MWGGILPLNLDPVLGVQFLLAGFWLLHATFWFGHAIGYRSTLYQKLIYAACLLIGVPVFRCVLLKKSTEFLGFKMFYGAAFESIKALFAANKEIDPWLQFGKKFAGSVVINEIVNQKNAAWSEALQLILINSLRFWTYFSFNIGWQTDTEIAVFLSPIDSTCRSNFADIFLIIKLCVVAPCALVGFAYGRFRSLGFGHMESTKKTLGWGKSLSSTSASASASANGSGDKSPRAKSRSRSRPKKNW